MSHVDLAELFAILGMEAAVVALLFYRRIYLLFPVFSVYLAWTIVSDLILTVAKRHYANDFFSLYLYEVPLDSILQFGVLVELAWSVLRPLRSALPRWTVAAIAGLILIASMTTWPIAGFTPLHHLPAQWQFLLRLDQTFSILRILFFIILAAGSQFLSLSWRDRELQLATGLGFYSLMDLTGTFLHAQTNVQHFHLIDQAVSASYFCSLIYWTVSFLQKEAPRQEFTPQMRNFLLTVSGAARTGRIALQENSFRRDRRP